jgi:hypothetical protein
MGLLFNTELYVIHVAPRFLGKLCTPRLHVKFWLLAGMPENEHKGSNAE